MLQFEVQQNYEILKLLLTVVFCSGCLCIILVLTVTVTA